MITWLPNHYFHGVNQIPLLPPKFFFSRGDCGCLILKFPPFHTFLLFPFSFSFLFSSLFLFFPPGARVGTLFRQALSLDFFSSSPAFCHPYLSVFSCSQRFPGGLGLVFGWFYAVVGSDLESLHACNRWGDSETDQGNREKSEDSTTAYSHISWCGCAKYRRSRRWGDS